MYNNWDYPAGADTPDAPWNEKELPEREFDVAVSYSISREAKVTTNDYDGGEYDEDGIWWAGNLNNPQGAYNNEFKSISEIIDFAKECAEYMLSKKDFKVRPKYTLKKFIDSCVGWVVDEENAEQD